MSLEVLSAAVSGVPWQRAVQLVAELWVQERAATAAVLVYANGPDQLGLTCVRIKSDGSQSLTQSLVDAPFSLLLDEDATIDVVVESGLIGGARLQVLMWPDLTANLVVLRSETQDDGVSTSRILGDISRRILSQSEDREILLPESSLQNAMAEYAAGAGHEINNPLASILGQSQLLLKSEQSPETRQALETISVQALRIRDMIGNSMLFARPPAPAISTLNLVELAQQTLMPLNSVAAASGTEIRLASTSDAIELNADRAQISTLIAHLVRNSVESLRSARQSGQISVTLHDDQPGVVELCVADNGPGVTDPTVRRNLFNPFYSGRSAGRGLGFGLCLAWQIVRMHHGMLIYHTPPNGGASFHAALPSDKALINP
ncbi:MAG: sensor histidine kinase [Planctomycetota bacterium]